MRRQLSSAFDRFADFTVNQKRRVAGGPLGRRPVLLWALAVVLLLLLLWYPIGGLIYQRIDDDMSVSGETVGLRPGASEAVAVAAHLAEREARHWAPNKPFWHPIAAFDNMPNYQLGLMYALARFGTEMADQLGRTRGSSAIDPDLDRAAGLLKYDGRVWMWGSGNLIPTSPADAQYLKAVQALRTYNDRLAEGRATYDRRADNLIGLLQRIGADLGSASAALEGRAESSNAGWFDLRADDLFYNVKGRLYAYAIVLRAVGRDFDGLLKERAMTALWTQMLDSLEQAARMDPLIVANGSEDGVLVPSHLSAQGFFLLRSRIQLSEITDALAK